GIDGRPDVLAQPGSSGTPEIMQDERRDGLAKLFRHRRVELVLVPCRRGADALAAVEAEYPRAAVDPLGLLLGQQLLHERAKRHLVGLLALVAGGGDNERAVLDLVEARAGPFIGTLAGAEQHLHERAEGADLAGGTPQRRDLAIIQLTLALEL